MQDIMHQDIFTRRQLEFKFLKLHFRNAMLQMQHYHPVNCYTKVKIVRVWCAFPRPNSHHLHCTILKEIISIQSTVP